MKAKKCPARKHCFDYKDNNCDNCDFGNEFTKLHKRIDRLKKQNETLTIQRNAWYLTAERVGEELKNAKAEVAKEIFAEIEEAKERWEAIYSSDHFGYGGGAYGYLETDVDHTIYELKKKYQEGE